jgi:hypothetical protein
MRSQTISPNILFRPPPTLFLNSILPSFLFYGYFTFPAILAINTFHIFDIHPKPEVSFLAMGNTDFRADMRNRLLEILTSKDGADNKSTLFRIYGSFFLL